MTPWGPVRLTSEGADTVAWKERVGREVGHDNEPKGCMRSRGMRGSLNEQIATTLAPWSFRKAKKRGHEFHLPPPICGDPGLKDATVAW